MKTKDQLIDNLAKIIGEYSDDSEVINKLLKVYLNKKLTPRTVGLVFKGQIPLESLSDIEQGTWCYYLNEITKEKILEPSEYFSDSEINEIISFVDDSNELEMKTDKVVLHGVKKLIVNGKVQYLCPFVGYYELAKFNNNHLLTYNFETQRQAKMTAYKGKIIKQVNVNKESVRQIGDLIYEGKFTANLVTVNIRRDNMFSEENVYFEKYSSTISDLDLGDLTIIPDGKNVFLDIIDGFHRLNSLNSALSKANKNGKILEGGFMVSITNFTKEESNDYIVRENKRNNMNKEHIKAIAKDDINIFIKALNIYGESSTNKMNNKICDTFEELELYNKTNKKTIEKYTTINILHDGYKLSGDKFSDPFENKMLLRHYINIFNTVIGYYMYKYENNIEKIKETIIFEPNVYVGIIAIGKSLLNKENYEDILMELLENNKINLKRDAHNWENLDMFKKNPRSYKKIYDYFEKLIKEEIK